VPDTPERSVSGGFPALSADGAVVRVARAVADAGGRALIVGGWVRDRIAATGRDPADTIESKDIDLEVQGLSLDRLKSVLARFGEVRDIGAAFGVLQVGGLPFDVSMPRTHHGGPLSETSIDPDLAFDVAARRRDLTINALGFDPLSGEILDPCGGRADLEAGRLRAADPAHFGDDPLRALRVPQLMARFGFTPDEPLRALCAAQDLGSVAPERQLEEWKKLLLRGRTPSLGLAFLREADLLRFYPELAALVDVPQDPHWHPEGDVWIHTLMVVDRIVEVDVGEGAPSPIRRFAALLHDLGKPAVTEEVDGRIRSPGHDHEGVALARDFLERLKAPNAWLDGVAVLVEHHLAPALYVKQQAGARAYRKLARRLAEGGQTLADLECVARADHLGRTTEEALARVFPAGDAFLERAGEARVREAPRPDVVLGRHLIARGLAPGPRFGEILERCRTLQDDEGLDEPDAILDRVLADG